MNKAINNTHSQIFIFDNSSNAEGNKSNSKSIDRKYQKIEPKNSIRPKLDIENEPWNAEAGADNYNTKKISKCLDKVKLEMTDSNNIQSNAEAILLLFEFLWALHDHQHKVGDHDKEWTVLGENAEACDETTVFRREIAGCYIHFGLSVVETYYPFIDIFL